jgi:hypothetical protein
MTQRKSLVNQQVRREREIFGSFVTRLKVARPPLRRLAALVQSRLYAILYTIYLSLTLTYTLNDKMTQKPRFLCGRAWVTTSRQRDPIATIHDLIPTKLCGCCIV